jgi:acyl-coenzyme A synthetase/AMP-(fatty) acid ligase
VCPLTDMPLLAAPGHLDMAAVVGEKHVWTWREIHAASLVLAEQLDDVTTLCNLCASRVGFLVTWLAAMRRGCLQLLPPSGGHADLFSMLQSCVRPLIIVDDIELLKPHWAEHARCMVHVPQVMSSLVDGGDLWWTPDWDDPKVHLYTSGSTGTPEPQTRTLRQLVRGAQLLGAQLDSAIDGGLQSVHQIISSVPPQHMFGVETSVMLSLVHGISVHECRPLLAADICAALARCESGAAWVATPLHLRAVVQSGETLPNCRIVISSTMPLAPALALQTELLAAAPVLEIYGSTETGAIAIRQSACSTQWRAMAGVRIETRSPGTGILVWGEHFPSPQTLEDAIETDSEGAFRLLGRQGDVIKIAGRRASLAGLNQLLQDLPGLSDGVFYLPDTGDATQRLALIYAGKSLDRAATATWLRERMDPVFLPRSVIRVERLPRTDNGKLPQAALAQIFAAWLTDLNKR